MKDIINFNIHKDSYKFILTFGLLSLICLIFFSKFLFWLFFIITAFIVYFFRNPIRYPPKDSKCILSPADGKISNITLAPLPPELNFGDKKFWKVSIFLSIFNCHINRIPIKGIIKGIYYKPGQFLNAMKEESSKLNERNTVLIRSTGDKDFIMVQIAGMIARRIVCDINQEDSVEAGEIMGIIRFGSRVDLYFDESIKPLVIENQNVYAGESIIAIDN